MKLHVENFAKIKEADIEINGITVIAGENNTGKSTIGKILYCLYSVFKDLDLKVVKERKRTIARVLFNNELIRDKIMPFSQREDSNEIMRMVDDIYNLDTSNLISYLNELPYDFAEDDIQKLNDALRFKSEDLGSLIIGRYFSIEFKGQYLPVSNENNASNLILNIKNKKNKILFVNKNAEYLKELDLVKDCIYIDNPFLLDDIDNRRGRRYLSIFDFIFGESDYYIHNELLSVRLAKSLEENKTKDLITDAVLDNRLSRFKDMIIKIVKGDFLEKEDKFVFLEHETNREIELENLSTGVKSLAILLKLLENKDISDKSMIVLDEPEIHLHPKWQLVFAEILVLLQKEFNLNIVLTSHSPYFISAIQAYSKKYSMTEICKYYLADLDDKNTAFFEDVTDNPGKIFDKLAESFDELDQIMYGEV